MTLRNHGRLATTPRNSDGSPLQVKPAWWHRLKLYPSNDTARHVLRQSGTITGPATWQDGVELVPVTFATWDETCGDIVVLLNGYVDSHRVNLRPTCLATLPTTPLRAATFLLPADAIVSYRFADITGLPDDIGRTRDGWLQLLKRARPDRQNSNRFAAPLGGDVSLWVGPRAPFGNSDIDYSGAPAVLWPKEEVPGWTMISTDDRQIRVLPGDSRILVLLDGQKWSDFAPGAAIRHAGHSHTVVLVPCNPDQRETDLTSAASAARLLRLGLTAAASVLDRPIAYADIVAGQSFGGLAVASLALDYPELLRAGIMQSASLWYPERGRPEGGELLHRVESETVTSCPPLIVQVGSEEGEMPTWAYRFRNALVTHGANVGFREIRGGHDYAWWRPGLIAALDELAAD